MRQILIIFSFCTLTQLACRKDSVTRKEDIYGQWEWVNSIGGFTGRDTINPPSRAAVLIDFKNDLTYTTTIDGQIIAQGTFQISNEDGQKIIRVNNFVKTSGLWFEANGEVIQIDNNKLRLTDYQISEPYTHNFIR